jgi:hypothetical protein
MSRFSRSVRIAVAGLLAVSALTIFGASPASAAATASMVDNGNGSITVTYSGVVPGSNGFDVVLAFMSQGATCPVNAYPNPNLFSLYANSMGGGAPVMAASPATIGVGTSVMGPNGPGAVPLTSGNYQACLYTQVNSGANITYTNAGSLAVTIGQVTPTTTATTSSPTTTTAAGTPVAPAFTG